MSKQSSRTTKDRSSKKLDPAITVALIALVGTLVTALFSSPVVTAWMQRTPSLPAQTIPTATVSTDSSGLTQSSPTSPIPVASSSSENCLTQYFADIDSAKQVSIEVGAYAQDFYLSSDELASKEFLGPFGVKLTQNGKMIAALTFLFFPHSQLFKLTSIVDSKCQSISEYSNTSNSGDPNAIGNTSDLQFQLAEIRFALGFQFSGTDFIRFTFIKMR